jgi:hypothetical protein
MTVVQNYIAVYNSEFNVIETEKDGNIETVTSKR